MADDNVTPSRDHERRDPDLCWLVQGVIEPCGERFALFDDDERCREALRIRRDLATLPGFEPALRYGVRQFSRARPASAAAVQLDADDAGEALLVSELPEGLRLSDVIETRAPLDALSVRSLAYELIAAVQQLHEPSRPSPHGALTPERLVLTARGHFSILDGGLGTALRTVPNTREAFWDDFRVAMPPVPASAEALDLYQSAIIVLELTLGRRLSAGEFPERIPELVQRAASTPLLDVAGWLRTALGIEAGAGFADTDLALDAFVSATAPHLSALHGHTMAVCLRSLGLTAEAFDLEWAPAPSDSRSDAVIASPGAERLPLPDVVEQVPPPVPATIQVAPEHTLADFRVAPERRPLGRIARSAAAVLGVAVLATAATGVVWLTRGRAATPPTAASSSKVAIASSPSGADVFVDGRLRGRTPIAIDIAPGAHLVRLTHDGSSRELTVSARAGVNESQYIELPPPAPPAEPAAHAPAPDRAPAVSHAAATRRTDVAPQTASAAPASDTAAARQTGLASFNAAPWADVAVDGRPIGQTPLGNVTLPVGVHEITFSHPDLGTQRRTITVAADAAVRVGVDLRRQP